MPVKSVAILKTFFETGDRPTESQFGDLIDSFVHKTTGAVAISNNYDEATGAVSISFSDGSTLAFNVKGNENEPISFIIGLQDALDGKVDKVSGKGLSTNDFTNANLTKLNGLENYVPPTSAAISFIDGLQAALDLKANDADVVKSVNNVPPDASGNVNVPTTVPFDLSNTPSWLNYSYFGKNVFGILIEIPASTAGDTYTFVHNLDVDKYLRVEQWKDGLDKLPLQSDIEARVDMRVLSFDISLDDDEAVMAGYAFPAGTKLYVEFTTNDPIIEGIASDAIGSAAIGQD